MSEDQMQALRAALLEHERERMAEELADYERTLDEMGEAALRKEAEDCCVDLPDPC
jgi:hypothetical protein